MCFWGWGDGSSVKCFPNKYEGQTLDEQKLTEMSRRHGHLSVILALKAETGNSQIKLASKTSHISELWF